MFWSVLSSCSVLPSCSGNKVISGKEEIKWNQAHWKDSFDPIHNSLSNLVSALLSHDSSYPKVYNWNRSDESYLEKCCYFSIDYEGSLEGKS